MGGTPEGDTRGGGAGRPAQKQATTALALQGGPLADDEVRRQSGIRDLDRVQRKRGALHVDDRAGDAELGARLDQGPASQQFADGHGRGGWKLEVEVGAPRFLQAGETTGIGRRSREVKDVPVGREDDGFGQHRSSGGDRNNAGRERIHVREDHRVAGDGAGPRVELGTRPVRVDGVGGGIGPIGAETFEVGGGGIPVTARVRNTGTAPLQQLVLDPKLHLAGIVDQAVAGALEAVQAHAFLRRQANRVENVGRECSLVVPDDVEEAADRELGVESGVVPSQLQRAPSGGRYVQGPAQHQRRRISGEELAQRGTRLCLRRSVREFELSVGVVDADDRGADRNTRTIDVGARGEIGHFGDVEDGGGAHHRGARRARGDVTRNAGEPDVPGRGRSPVEVHPQRTQGQPAINIAADRGGVAADEERGSVLHQRLAGKATYAAERGTGPQGGPGSGGHRAVDEKGARPGAARGAEVDRSERSGLAGLEPDRGRGEMVEGARGRHLARQREIARTRQIQVVRPARDFAAQAQHRFCGRGIDPRRTIQRDGTPVGIGADRLQRADIGHPEAIQRQPLIPDRETAAEAQRSPAGDHGSRSARPVGLAERPGIRDGQGALLHLHQAGESVRGTKGELAGLQFLDGPQGRPGNLGVHQADVDDGTTVEREFGRGQSPVSGGVAGDLVEPGILAKHGTGAVRRQGHQSMGGYLRTARTNRVSDGQGRVPHVHRRIDEEIGLRKDHPATAQRTGGAGIDLESIGGADRDDGRQGGVVPEQGDLFLGAAGRVRAIDLEGPGGDTAEDQRLRLVDAGRTGQAEGERRRLATGPGNRVARAGDELRSRI